MKIKLQGSQVNSLATASNVGFATLVRVYNSTAADIGLTQKEGATVIGTITIPSKGIEYIQKMPSQTLQGGAGLLAVSIAFTS
jgi:hypothetical protein|tara:strand:+ start:474 stop:722 length:249 start_codon:yes stop_codon:yes gene_type:complete